MVEARQPGKLFLGGINIETNENTLEAVFGQNGNTGEVLSIKYRETEKSRAFAYISFENPADAEVAAREMNGKTLDGKTIKVEQVNKPSFESDGRQRPRLLLRNRDPPRCLRCGKGGSGKARGYPSHGRHLDDGEPTVHLSSSRGPLPVKRGKSSRSAGPPPKRCASTGLVRSSSGRGGQGPVLGERENYGGPPHRKRVCTWREDYVSARYNSYAGRDYSRSRDAKHYAPPSRDCGHFKSRAEHSSTRYNVRNGYGGGRDRDYSEHASYGISGSALPARGFPVAYGGSSRYDDCRSPHAGRRQENYSSSRSDNYSSHRERGGIHERGFLPPMGRVHPPSRESRSGSRCGASRQGWRKSQSRY